MTTDELREAFLVDLFEDGKLNLLYCEVERSIVGAAVPQADTLKLEAGAELAADFFCQRREVGVLNLGGKGSVIIDEQVYAMDNLDAFTLDGVWKISRSQVPILKIPPGFIWSAIPRTKIIRRL